MSIDVNSGDNDAALVDAARRELPYVTIAYTQLVARHQRLVFGYCLRMLGNRADADDVCQDVMIKVLNALPGFEGRSTFKTWLMRITVNACNTALSKARRREQVSELYQTQRATDPPAAIKTAEFDVNRLLESLNDVDRQLVVLRYVAELGFEEIADIAGMKLSATKMRIYRAVQSLQELGDPERADT